MGPGVLAIFNKWHWIGDLAVLGSVGSLTEEYTSFVSTSADYLGESYEDTAVAMSGLALGAGIVYFIFRGNMIKFLNVNAEIEDPDAVVEAIAEFEEYNENEAQARQGGQQGRNQGGQQGRNQGRQWLL